MRLVLAHGRRTAMWEKARAVELELERKRAPCRGAMELLLSLDQSNHLCVSLLLTGISPLGKAKLSEVDYRHDQPRERRRDIRLHT